MSHKYRMVLFWILSLAAVLTFAAVVGIAGFEAHVRWSLNQNYSVLDTDSLLGLLLLLSAEILSLVWLVRG
jgi:hypothetical protein